jgi:hypothetical protein
MVRPTVKTLVTLSLLGGLALAAPARAGLLPVTFSTAPEGGSFRYTYGVVLSSDAFIKPGDYFTIYDFAGFVPGSTLQPAGWTVMTGAGKTPSDTHPTDDPGIPNLTWVYTGPQINGQKGLGNFSALSSIDASALSSFTASTHRSIDSHVDSNITDVSTPAQGPGGGGNSPEPATLALLGLGLPLAGAARLLRRRSK